MDWETWHAERQTDNWMVIVTTGTSGVPCSEGQKTDSESVMNIFTCLSLFVVTFVFTWFYWLYLYLLSLHISLLLSLLFLYLWLLSLIRLYFVFTLSFLLLYNLIVAIFFLSKTVFTLYFIALSLFRLWLCSVFTFDFTLERNIFSWQSSSRNIQRPWRICSPRTLRNLFPDLRWVQLLPVWLCWNHTVNTSVEFRSKFSCQLSRVCFQIKVIKVIFLLLWRIYCFLSDVLWPNKHRKKSESSCLIWQ